MSQGTKGDMVVPLASVQLVAVQTRLSSSDIDKIKVMGTVKLTNGDIVYIPAPTADPQDPLNMPYWQKMVVTLVLSAFSVLGLSLVSGLGGLLGFYTPAYIAAGKTRDDIFALMTYPTLFMGIGNLIGMPVARAVGRRSVILASTCILFTSAILCATAKSYEWHLAARMVLGLAAGQSEALVPLIIQEIFFLHERSRSLMIQETLQGIATFLWVLFASPIASRITPQGWYGLGAALAGVELVLAVLFLPETKYARPLESLQVVERARCSDGLGSDAAKENDESYQPIISTLRPALDYVNFQPRTLKSDMRLWVDEPKWIMAYKLLKETFTVMLFPVVFWAMCLNGLCLGGNVAIVMTYGTIITSAPYNWPQSTASYVTCGQVVSTLAALPLLGYGPDRLIKWKADRNGGIHEPETRLIPLIIPIMIGVLTTVIYGQGATYPDKYHWFFVVWAVAAYYFTFIAVNISCFTYLLDSYPTRSGPILVAICAFRGIFSFGVVYGIAPFLKAVGYDGMFNIFAVLTGFLGLCGLPIYFFGKRIRNFTARWVTDS